MNTFNLTLLPEQYCVFRLEPEDCLPSWVNQEGFFSITHTAEEISIICQEVIVPPAIQCQTGWRILKFEGTFEFSQTGVLASVALPLAQYGVSLLAISTYDTDYVLIHSDQLDRAIQLLQQAGHTIRLPGD